MAKSIRLNKQLRQDILDNIMGAYDIANPQPVEPIADTKNSIVKTLLEITLKKNQKLLDLIKNNYELLKEDFNSCGKYTSLIYNNYDGNFKSVYLGNFLSTEELSLIPRSLFKNAVINLEDSNQVSATLKKVIDADKLFNKTTLKQFSKDNKEWSTNHKNYKAQVSTVLEGVNTTNQLLEVWPEVEKFLPVGVLEPSKIQLPSVSISTLNSALIK